MATTHVYTHRLIHEVHLASTRLDLLLPSEMLEVFVTYGIFYKVISSY